MQKAHTLSEKEARHPMSRGVLVVSPAGELLCKWQDGAETYSLQGEDMLDLLQEESTADLTPSMVYLRNACVCYVRELLNNDGAKRADTLPESAPGFNVSALSGDLPPILGAEYWSEDVLAGGFAKLYTALRRRLQRNPQQILAECVRELNPQWKHWGKIVFHLAENKVAASQKLPFAFMATYVDAAPEGEGKHWPLAAALKLRKLNPAAFEQLVTPLEQLANTCPFMAQLLHSQRIFRACAFSPKEAFRFLQEQQLYQQAGVQVRVFNIWKQKPLRPKLRISLDSPGKLKMGAASLLEFSVQAVLGDTPLSRAELQSLMKAEGALVQLRGEWVVANAEQIQQLLSQWKQAEKAAGQQGLTMIEGLRLLAGVPEGGGGLPGADETVEYTCGQSLAELLHPDRVPAAPLPGMPFGLGEILRPYQHEGVSYMYRMLNMGAGVCLADDMGLGKTLQTLTLLALWKAEGVLNDSPALLVVPATLIRNWQSEATRFTPGLRVGILHPSAASSQEQEMLHNRDAELLKSYDLVLTTYGMLSRQDMLQRVEFAAVIADEAQAIKNAASTRSRALRALKSPRRIALTGTPIENSMGDLWSIFDFINPGLLGKHTQFRTFVRALDNHYAPLRKLTAPFILRRLKSDKHIISDLPDKTEVKLYCSLTARQAALYTRCVEQLRNDLENEELPTIRRKGLVLAYLARFKQICNHPTQFIGTGVYEAKASGKFARLAELAESAAARQEKMLIFTQYRELCAPLHDFLATCFGRKGLVLHGGTPVKKRAALVEDFQQENGPPFFVISLKAGGTGLNLTAANHVVHFDRWWNPAVESQASDRAYRIGQRRNVLIHKFVCTGTLEEKIDAIIDTKQNMADSMLAEGAEKLLTEMSNDELVDFVSFAHNSLTAE